MNIVKKYVAQSGKNMSNEFCSYPVSDCQLSPLLASYEQRIEQLQTALGNMELDAILAEAQKLEDAKRIEELQVREEAIVRAALLRAAYYVEEVWEPLDKLLPFASKEMNAAARTGQYEAAERIAISIRSLASDPSEVAAIIAKAGEN
jgi:hypothetical protein